MQNFPNATMPIAIVVNPKKVPDLPEYMDQVNEALLNAGKGEPAWYETTAEDAGFGQTQAALASGATVVVACGGDGTVRECARALLGKDVALGILPAGTGNLLARALDIPLGTADALNVVVGGQRRRIDVGDADGQTFLVMAGMGFDAEMVGDASEGMKARFGVAAYVWTALRNLFKPQMRVQVTLDAHAPLRRQARCVLVGKVGRLPGGIRLMDVEASDGNLAVAILAANNLGHWLGIVWAVFTRRTRVPRLETFHAKRVRIHATRVQRREVDGDELAPANTLDVRVVPGALLVCLPESS